MAAAAAEGKLEDFLKQEMPDNEYARNLANMMMGMTGMMSGSMPGMSMNPVPEKGKSSQHQQARPQPWKFPKMSGTRSWAAISRV